MPTSVIRSTSAPPISSTHGQVSSDEETNDFPAFIHDNEYDADTHHWTRDLLPSSSSRQSRASSIISTRTRFSTTTLDEVRSIEINAGGHTFRISRDGSQVSDVSAPPPYPGTSFKDEDDAEYTHADAAADSQERHEPQQSNPTPVGPRKRVRIVMPGEEEDELESTTAQDESQRDQVLSKTDLYQIMTDLPVQLKRILGIRIPGYVQRCHQAGELPANTSTQLESTSFKAGASNHINLDSNSAQPLPMVSESSNYGLAGLQPRGRHDSVLERVGYSSESSDARSSTDTLRASQQDQNVDVHMTVGDLNELSSLYNGVIRDLDREHRKKLHERDKEMEQLRSMLHEKDIVYRQQLRGKDFVIEDLRNRLKHQEDSMQKQLELARHEVEDVWEKRWKGQESHLMERIKRTENIETRG